MKYLKLNRLLWGLTAVTAALLLAAACANGTGGQQTTEALDTQTPTETTSAADPSPASSATIQEQPTAASATIQPDNTLASDDGIRAVTTESPVATAVPSPTTTPSTVNVSNVGGVVGDQAPEFTSVANWINSSPLTMESLRGKVVLIDFWTYTCINCIRTFPFLRDWHAKYADKGLAIIGVHTPEFDFEKLTENVARNAAESGIVWPIAQDNDYGTWRAYSNRFWPAKYLVDQDGKVRYTHFGEGAYTETESIIRELLEEAGANLDDVEIGSTPDQQADPRAYTQDQATRLTREIYGGFQRNATPQGIYVAHSEYYEGPDQTLDYADPGDHQNQFVYLQGLWSNGAERLRHARETQNYEDYIALKFFATSVNVVIDPEGGAPFDVQVTIDGRPLLPQEAGSDVVVESDRSFFRVKEARLYEVVMLAEFGGHELKLSSNSPDFAFFAFTFGAYSEGA